MVRGKKYRFVVEGGENPETPARYHPFYITDDPVGGYQHKTPEEKEVRFPYDSRSTCVQLEEMTISLVIVRPIVESENIRGRETSTGGGSTNGCRPSVQLAARSESTSGRRFHLVRRLPTYPHPGMRPRRARHRGMDPGRGHARHRVLSGK